MEKSMLILYRIPVDCDDNGLDGAPCFLRVLDCETDEFICAKTGKRVAGYRGLGERPDWCPICPMPEYKPYHYERMQQQYNMGWNDCLDAIEGRYKDGRSISEDYAAAIDEEFNEGLMKK